MTPTMHRKSFGSAWLRPIMGAAGLTILGGCVEVTAPDGPIEINLNINIRQEVVVRLQQDARDLIQRDGRDY